MTYSLHKVHIWVQGLKQQEPPLNLLGLECWGVKWFFCQDMKMSHGKCKLYLLSIIINLSKRLFRDDISGPKPDFLTDVYALINQDNQDASSGQSVIDFQDNESDEGDTDDCLFDGEPDGEDVQIGDLIDLFDSAGLEHILSGTEHNQDLNLIDFDLSLSNIEPLPADTEFLTSIMADLQGLNVVAEGSYDDLEVVDVGDRLLWSGSMSDIEKEFPSISGGHGEWKPSGNLSDDSDDDLQIAIGGSLFTPQKP